MSWRERVVNDGSVREDWLAARRHRIGASDAAKFARIESADRYLASKLSPASFGGNESTRNGHNWEEAILTSAGFEQNKALIHHPTEHRFVCTPDGFIEGNSLRLAEVKTRNMRITEGPSPSEVRQMAFQMYVIPEAESVSFLWGEIVRDHRSPDGWRLHRAPQSLVFHRDHDDIVRATTTIIPIANRVLDLLDAAALTKVPF